MYNLLKVSIPITVICFLIILGLIFLERKMSINKTGVTLVKFTIMIFAITILGSVAGYSGGLSRVAAVGNIIPAVMGLLGGVTVYLFGLKDEMSMITPIIVAAFAISLFLGYSNGAHSRGTSDTFEKFEDKCFSLYFDTNSMTNEKMEVINRHHGNICKQIFKSSYDKIKID